MTERRNARVNVRLLLILAGATVLLGIGAFAGHRIRKRVIARQALVTATQALDQSDWLAACRHLQTYLEVFHGDADALNDYARANLAVRPLESRNVGAAIAALRHLRMLNPTDTSVLSRFAKLYLRFGDLNEAAYIAREWQQHHPDDTAATVLLAEILIEQNKYVEATELLGDLYDQQPQEQVFALLHRITHEDKLRQSTRTIARLVGYQVTQRRDSNIELGARVLDEGIKRCPDSAMLYLMRGRLHRLTRGDLHQARQDLEAAEQRQSTHPDVLLALFSEWLQLDEIARAERIFEATEALSSADLERHEVDREKLTVAKYNASAALVLKKQDHHGAARLAKRMLDEAPEYDRMSYLPLVIELLLAGHQTERAKERLAEFSRRLGERGAIDRSLANMAVFLEARIASSEDKPYEVIRLLEPLVIRDAEKDVWKLLARAYDATGHLRRESRLLDQYLDRWPDDPGVNVQQARVHIKRRLWSKAHDYALVAEASAPFKSDAQQLRVQARAYALLEETHAPIELRALRTELQTLQQAYPHVTSIYILLAHIAERLGEIDTATELLQQAVADSDRPLSAAMQLVELHRLTDQAQLARKVCQQAIADHKAAARPRQKLADLHLEAGQTEQAHDTLQRAVQELQGREQLVAQFALSRHLLAKERRLQGIALLDEMVADGTGGVRPHLALLSLPELRAQPKRAQALVDAVQRIETESGLQWRAEQACVWLSHSDWQERKQQVIALLEECIARDPGWSRPVQLLGRTYEMLNEDNEAEKLYREFVGAYPAGFAVMAQLLDLLERQQRFADAQDLLDRIPRSFLSLGMRRVNVALGTGDRPAAIKELERLVAAEPQNTQSRTLLAKILYSHTGDADTSLKMLDQVQSIAPDQITGVATRVWILSQEDRNREARDIVNNQVERRNDFASYLLRGQFRLAEGDLTEAEEDLKRLTTFKDFAVQGYSVLGRFYQQLGRTDEAIAAWRTGLQADPAEIELQMSLVCALVGHPNEDMRNEGQPMLQALLTQHPGEPSLLFAQARVLLSQGTPEALNRAYAQLEEVVRRSPLVVQAHLLLVELDIARQDRIKARERVARALSANPGNDDLLLAHAVIERDFGRTDAARQFAETVMVRDRENVRALQLMAEIELNAGRLEAAARHIEQALTVDAEDERNQVYMARIINAQGRHDEAVTVLDQYCNSAAGRNSILAHLALAEFHRDGNAPAQAERVLEKLGGSADNAAVAISRLQCWVAMGRYEDVRKHLQDIRHGGAEQARVLVVGAAMLAASGRADLLSPASRFYERAVAMRPNSIDGNLGLAHIRYLTGDFEGARQSYASVLKLNPYHREALNDLAWITGEELNRPQEGLELANKAVDRYPRDPSLLDTRAVLLFRLGRFDEARVDLEQCLSSASIGPRTKGQALFHLSRVQHEQGRQLACRQSLEEALRLDRKHDIFRSEQRSEIEAMLTAPMQ